jgi:hypothetical protein
MERTLISLEPEDKAWLAERARQEGVSMAELVRQAIKRFRSEGGAEPTTTEELLARTAGIARGEQGLRDGLERQRRLRSEWDDRC